MTGQRGRSEATAAADKYDELMRLAELFDAGGRDLRDRARLGAEILADDDVADSESLSPATYGVMAEDVRTATTGQHGLLARSVELDADALVVRATVLTYRWIDELQRAAYETLGSIAGRAIGYLAPEVALGGAIVGAGLIETDALDRDDVAGYLNELAGQHPDLLDHLTSGGGGLVETLEMRSLLTSGVPASDTGPLAATGGLRALGLEPFAAEAAAAVRDVAGGFAEHEDTPVGSGDGPRPSGLGGLMEALAATAQSVAVHDLGGGRFLVHLPGPHGAATSGLRLVGGDHASYAARVREVLADATAGVEDARVMLVGTGAGGAVAAEIAADPGPGYTVEQVVTAGSPGAHVPRVPESVHVLSLEDRSDPVAMLGSLLTADVAHRLTVVHDAGGAGGGQPSYVAGGHAADAATDRPELAAELERLRRLGYLAG